jgi:hypothetical protein
LVTQHRVGEEKARRRGLHHEVKRHPPARQDLRAVAERSRFTVPSSQSSEKPAAVFRRFSAFMACPPMNWPPSAENTPMDG